MKETIKLIDLCCKAGGAAMGYYQAAQELNINIEITGIDIDKQKNYPFKFIQADAVDFFSKNSHKFTHAHASPPCQKYSNSTAQWKMKGKVYPDILEAIQLQIIKSKLPGVIENVMPAPIPADIVLRGDMFNLKVLKKRKFQLINWFMLQPGITQKRGTVKNGDFAQVLGKGQLKVTNGKKFNVPGNNILEVWSNAMGINWMNKEELAEAIPPAYTKYIGLNFLKQ